jgi:glutamine cyclotransferase
MLLPHCPNPIAPHPHHPGPQITWQTPKGFKFSADSSLKQLGSFDTPLQDGWGLTSDGKHLIATDGSDTITWIDPANMSKVSAQPASC